MTTEPLSTSYAVDTASLAQLRRENERLRHQNAQLEDQVRAFLILQDIANTLSVELDLQHLLRRIAIAALRLTSAHVSAIYLVDTSSRELIVEAVETVNSASDSGIFSAFDFVTSSNAGIDSSGVDVYDTGRPRISIGSGIAGAVASSGTLVLLTDATKDARFSPEMLAVDSAILRVPLHGIIAVPMLFNSEITGVLEVAHAEQGTGFDATNLDLMRTLAAQAATAVANARLYRRLRTEHDRIIQAQEDERKRLGRDLHDGAAQKLAQITMSLEFAQQLVQHEPERLPQELQVIHELATSTTREIRNQLFDLRPLVLDAESGGLVAALNHFLDRFQDDENPVMHLTADYPTRLSHNVEHTVFAILQEATNNVLKHANAHNCWIDIHETDSTLIATIRDDGQGFDVRQVLAEYETRGSWGLLSMHERAALIDGKLTIASQLGKGAVTSLEVPR